MTTSNNPDPTIPPWFQPAQYRDPLIPNYRGNPLIEALPPILLEEEAISQLARYPDFDPVTRELPAELRFHLILNILDFFEPLPIHIDLEQRFSRIIRHSYVGRNPLQWGHWQQLDTNVQTLSRGFSTPNDLSSTAVGFTLIGISGIGKTTAVRRILSLYNQVILHTKYQGQPFQLAQVVWLKLECPHDGSIRGLCLNFFTSLDTLLNTNYHRNYTRQGRATVDEMLPNMARIASIHKIGALVIDELQHLSEAKSGGPNKMLNFFVQLVNTMGVPVVPIGTYKAQYLLTKEFRQARRSTGQGDPIWDNMQEDEIWWLFLESLWRYQYVQKPAPLTKELSHVLYDETQGITDFAIKIFILAQVRGIVSGQETITPQIIRSVAAESLRLAAPALSAMRKKDMYALQQFEDITPIEIDSLIQQALEDLKQSQKESKPKKNKETTQAPQTSKRDKPKSSEEDKREQIHLKDDIREIVGQNGTSADQALSEAGVIKSPDEYLGEG